jgi:hypothetical protein
VLVIVGSAAPAAALLLILTCRARRCRHNDTTSLGAGGASPWAGLTEEMARRDHRPRPRSDEAMRRRHLAAVLPADARR